MARYKTVGEMTSSVRWRGDLEDPDGSYDDAFISTALMIDFVDSAYAEVYDTVVTVDPDRFLTDATVTPTAGGSATGTLYALPANLYRLRAVDINDNGWLPLQRYELAERGGWVDSDSSSAVYRLEGQNLKLLGSDGSHSLRLTYIPVATRLSSSAQTIDTVDGHDELIVLLALRRCKVRAQESTSEVDAEIARQTARIAQHSAERDRGSPRRLIDPMDNRTGRRRRW